MEEKMTRQIPGLNAFIDAIQVFLVALPATTPEGGLCTIVTTEATEELADLLDDLAEFIELEFTTGAYGFLAQIERLVCIIELLADRVRAITCPDSEECLDILNEVLCVLVEALAILIGIVIKLIVLDSFLGTDDDFETFFECLVCSLIEEITALEEAVKDLSCLIIALISCDIEECTPCYVATKAGKRPRVNVNKNICSCKKY